MTGAEVALFLGAHALWFWLLFSRRAERMLDAALYADGALGRHEPDDGQALIPTKDSAK